MYKLSFWDESSGTTIKDNPYIDCVLPKNGQEITIEGFGKYIVVESILLTVRKYHYPRYVVIVKPYLNVA